MSSQGSPQLLLVDDDRDMTTLLAMLLERRGFRVDVADSVSTAIATFENSRIDVLITDISLPDGTGYELLTRVPRANSVPAIAITGAASSEDARRSEEAGFHAHLAKPVEIEQLIAVLEDLLGDQQ